MGRAVSNATPLIYLAKAGKLHLLRAVFGEVLIPEEVKVEVVDRGKELGKKDAYAVEAAIEEGWLVVEPARGSARVPIELDPGELAVLSLAKAVGVEEVLVDEVLARAAAKLLGLKPRGTVYVLLKALEMGKMDFGGFFEALSELVASGFRFREEVYLEAVRRAKEIAERARLEP